MSKITPEIVGGFDGSRSGDEILWWEVEDLGAWPGTQPRPPLYSDEANFARPPMKVWARRNDWSLRPHP